MRFLDLTLDDPALNLALDEALLDACEHDAEAETLRVWEPPRPIVVLGRSSRVAEEAQLSGCRERKIPVLRRTSGGAAIVAGPGCLMYAVVLSYRRRPELRAIDRAHREVLGRHVASLAPLASGVACRGISDLAWRDRKVSGNSVRCRREALLYHGTLLYDFDLPLIGHCLGLAPRQPAYRVGRDHEEFVANLPLTRDQLVDALRAAWDARDTIEAWPRAATERLAARYRDAEWNERP